MEYKLVGLPETVTAFAKECGAGPRSVLFYDVPADNLLAWRPQFANIIEGMIESTILLLRVEVQVKLLNQTKS